MPTPEISDEVLRATVSTYEACERDQTRVASLLGLARSTVQNRLKRAAERGLMGTKPVLEGFRLTKTTAVTNEDGDVVREFIQQKPDLGAPYEPVESLAVKGRTTWADIHPDGTRIATREVIMERADAKAQLLRCGLQLMVLRMKFREQSQLRLRARLWTTC
jgi:DNA-binding Lrp family transcriptional regulator